MGEVIPFKKRPVLRRDLDELQRRYQRLYDSNDMALMDRKMSVLEEQILSGDYEDEQDD